MSVVEPPPETACSSPPVASQKPVVSAYGDYWEGGKSHTLCSHDGKAGIIKLVHKPTKRWWIFHGATGSSARPLVGWTLIDLSGGMEGFRMRSTKDFLSESSIPAVLALQTRQYVQPVSYIRLLWADGKCPPVGALFWDDLLQAIPSGHILFGCAGGHGRTGTALATMLCLAGFSSELAEKVVCTIYCSKAVETDTQQRYLDTVAAAVKNGALPHGGYSCVLAGTKDGKKAGLSIENPKDQKAASWPVPATQSKLPVLPALDRATPHHYDDLALSDAELAEYGRITLAELDDEVLASLWCESCDITFTSKHTQRDMLIQDLERDLIKCPQCSRSSWVVEIDPSAAEDDDPED